MANTNRPKPEGFAPKEPEMSSEQLRELLRLAHQRIAELEEENRELIAEKAKPQKGDKEIVKHLKESLEEKRDEIIWLKRRLFRCKDESEIKRVTFNRTQKKAQGLGLNLERMGKTVLVTYRWFDKVIKRQFKKVRDVWETLESATLDELSFNEILKQIFPQFNRRQPKTSTPRQHRPCCYCGMLIYWSPDPKTFGQEKIRYQPTNPDKTLHNCRDVKLSPDIYKEVMRCA